MDSVKIISLLEEKKGISLNQVLFKLESEYSLAVPEKIIKEYSSAQKKWNEKDSKISFKDENCLCISSYHIKNNKIYLNFCIEQYAKRQAVSESLRMITPIDQDYLLSEMFKHKIKLPLAYKINLGIISKDGNLILIKRSQKVATNRGKLDFSISKGVVPSDLKAKIFQPVVTVQRALIEELNIDVDLKLLNDKSILDIKEFYINRDFFSICLFGLLDMRKMENGLTAEQIRVGAENSKNNWEISEIIDIPLTKQSLKSFISKQEKKMTNYSLYNLQKVLASL